MQKNKVINVCCADCVVNFYSVYTMENWYLIFFQRFVKAISRVEIVASVFLLTCAAVNLDTMDHNLAARNVSIEIPLSFIIPSNSVFVWIGVTFTILQNWATLIKNQLFWWFLSGSLLPIFYPAADMCFACVRTKIYDVGINAMKYFTYFSYLRGLWKRILFWSERMFLWRRVPDDQRNLSK